MARLLVPTAQVMINPRNPRFIRTAKYEQLLDSLRNFPQMLEPRPVVVYTAGPASYMSLGGNMRLRCWIELCNPFIWIDTAGDDWTEEQRAEFLIKDNLSYGEWDWDELANVWNTDVLDAYGLDFPAGYTFPGEEQDADQGDGSGTGTGTGSAEELGEELSEELGDIYELRLTERKYSKGVTISMELAPEFCEYTAKRWVNFMRKHGRTFEIKRNGKYLDREDMAAMGL